LLEKGFTVFCSVLLLYQARSDGTSTLRSTRLRDLMYRSRQLGCFAGLEVRTVCLYVCFFFLGVLSARYTKRKRVLLEKGFTVFCSVLLLYQARSDGTSTLRSTRLRDLMYRSRQLGCFAGLEV